MVADYKIGAVIVAAGSGLRFGERKQFKKLNNKPLYQYSLERFLKTAIVSEIALVVPEDLVEEIRQEAKNINSDIRVVAGGELRQDSVLSGVNALSEDCELISVHDAARPFVTEQTIRNTTEGCVDFDGAIAAVPASDTVKEVDTNNKVKKTIPRESVWLAQTPQVFHRSKLLQALAYAKTNNIAVTDEATLLESLDFSVTVVEGDVNNFKITTPSDWTNAEYLLGGKND